MQGPPWRFPPHLGAPLRRNNRKSMIKGRDTRHGTDFADYPPRGPFGQYTI